MCSLLSCQVLFKRSLLIDKIVDVIVYFIMFFFKKNGDAVNCLYQKLDAFFLSYTVMLATSVNNSK